MLFIIAKIIPVEITDQFNCYVSTHKKITCKGNLYKILYVEYLFINFVLINVF